MDLILANKRFFVAIEVVSAIALALCIMSIKSESEVSVHSWQGICSFISALVFTAAFFPLCYLSWFSEATRNFSYYFNQVLFWLFAFGAAGTLLGIAYIFLMHS
jgi:hypothetical protein